MHTFSLTHSPPSLSLLCCRNGKCTTECASAPVELLHNGYYLGAARDAQWTSDRKYLASSAHIKQQQTYTEWEQSQHSDSWVGARARADTLSPGHSRRELARKWPNDVSQQSGRQTGRQSRFKCKCANEIKATQPTPVGKPPSLPLSYFSAWPHGPTVQHVDRVKCLGRNCCGLQHILLCSAPCTATASTATGANCPCRNARNYKVSKSLDHKSISHFWLSEQFMANQRRFRYLAAQTAEFVCATKLVAFNCG